MTTPAEPATTATSVEALLPQLAELLDGVPATESENPTPCSDYTVAALRQHMLGWLTAFADGYAAADGRCSDPEAVQIEGSGADQVRAAAQRLSSALADGAESRPLSIGDSQMPGAMALQMILWEYQVHGWDLATATDQPWRPDEAGVLASLEFAPMMLTADYQGEGKAFGPRVDPPAGATALERLVALSGRDPAWGKSARA